MSSKDLITSTLTISPGFVKDWKAHRQNCTKKKPKSPSGLNNSVPGGFQGATLDGRPVQPMPLNVPFPSHLTKYPVTFDIFTQKYTPVSLTAKFFEGDLGYKDEPIKMYADLVDAFKFNRAETLQGTEVKDEWSSEQAMKQFKSFVERGKKRDLLPAWWTPEHEAGLYMVAKDDDQLRVDRPYNWEERRKRVKATSKENDETRLGMITERVFFDEGAVTDPRDYSGPQYEAIGMY
ncbi:hypothetical protein FS837_004554 [Tulasnella sp. UAMH 9824]|nr:hypothetical protein FS837_004554 [Tulasnella sp. UAMH 9824]